MIGASLGNYRILRKLGEGGMGEVYEGRHEALGHPVAVKILRQELSGKGEMVKRFFLEAQAATSIRNPGIVQIHDFGTTAEGFAYFVMELLEGQSLAARLKQRRLELAECCRIGRQVATVLQAAHDRGIIHRDLKPDNLYLVPDPEVVGGERVKVLDFGIAKLAGEVQSTLVQTRTGLVMGTPTYMSPEQCRGAGGVDTRADIYSLGCILFEIASGRPPFLGEGAGEMVGAHIHVAPPSLQQVAPGVAPALAALVAQMLAKQPGARPATMAAVGQALDEILRTSGAALGSPSRSPAGRAMSAPPIRPSEPAPVPQLSTMSTTLGGAAGPGALAGRGGSRSPLLIGGGVLTAALAVVVIFIALRQSRPPESAPEPRGGEGAGSSARPVDAAAVALEPEAAGPAVAEFVDAPAPSGTGGARGAGDSEIRVECLRNQTEERWLNLDTCADRLKASDPALAKALKSRAIQEIRSAPRITAVKAALRDRDLQKAWAELEQIWTGATSYKRVKDEYDAAEAAAITDLIARLDRVNNGDCREYNMILTQERQSKPTRVATEAQRKVQCTPVEAPAPQGDCDADTIAEKGREFFSAGSYTEAIIMFDQAIDCRPDPSFFLRAFVTACNLRNVAKAKSYYQRLSPSMRASALPTCSRNNITEEELLAL